MKRMLVILGLLAGCGAPTVDVASEVSAGGEVSTPSVAEHRLEIRYDRNAFDPHTQTVRAIPAVGVPIAALVDFECEDGDPLPLTVPVTDSAIAVSEETVDCPRQLTAITVRALPDWLRLGCNPAIQHATPTFSADGSRYVISVGVVCEGDPPTQASNHR